MQGMGAEEGRPSEPEQPVPEFEEYPLSRDEYIAAMVHLYRGELGRANTWRIRLDTTTNWAIVSTVGILSFAFGDTGHPSAAIILGMYLVVNFLVLEARRYRFFDVWKNRVRMIEENFYTPLLRRDLVSPQERWGALVADDLYSPHFKISYLQAFKRRLRTNYLFLFLVLLAGWLGKALLQPATPALSLLERFGAGVVPWWVPVGVVAALYGFLAAVLLFVPPIREPQGAHWSREGREGALPDF